MYKKDEWRDDWQNGYNTWRSAGGGNENHLKKANLKYTAAIYGVQKGRRPWTQQFGTWRDNEGDAAAETDSSKYDWPPNLNRHTAQFPSKFFRHQKWYFQALLCSWWRFIYRYTHFDIFYIFLQVSIKIMPILLKELGSSLNFPLFSILS